LLSPSLFSGSELQPERLFGTLGLHHRRPVTIAVSGGSDSLSLLTLFHRWLGEHIGANAPVAVTVDHGLRPEAADEARQVAAFCASRDTPHIMKTWEEPKPSSGLAAAARAARYRLLIEAARSVGSDVILTGHTQDDQAETVAMRAGRGEGIGLAGMADQTLLDGSIWLMRPLLPVSRAALQDYLVSQNIPWIEDPSNSNPAAERVRVRAAMTPERRAFLLDKAREAALLRRDLADRAAGLLSRSLIVEPSTVRIAHNFFRAQDREAGIHAFRLLLGVLGRQPHWPDLLRSTALFDQLGQRGFSGSLAGCVVRHRRAGITISPERRGAGDHVDITTMFAGTVLRPIVPGFDLPAVKALARLLNARDLPAAPWSQHNGSFP
jgi:tRNA(Ile)-lysidine synthase